MKTNPLLEELWQVKDDLAREAGYDMDRIFAELLAAEGRQPGPLIRSAAEMRRYAEDEEHRHNAASALLLKGRTTTRERQPSAVMGSAAKAAAIALPHSNSRDSGNAE